MLSSKDITQSLLIAVAIILLITIVLSLVGCLTITDHHADDDGRLRINADCDANTIEIKLDIDETKTTKDAAVTK